MLVTFTRHGAPNGLDSRDSRGYAIDVVRDVDPPARMRVTCAFDELIPHELAHFLVEREFGLMLGIFGQLAAGGDAGTFWCAPSDRTATLAHRAYRLRVTGRGDLGRSERLTTACVCAWEIKAGRRRAGQAPPASVVLDADLLSSPATARIVELFDQACADWALVGTGESLQLSWPAALTLGHAARLRSA